RIFDSFFFQAEDGIRDRNVTGVQTCALPIFYDLRDYNGQAQDQYNFETEVSGQSVINIDMSKKLNDAIPVFAGVIVALAFVLLRSEERRVGKECGSWGAGGGGK